MDVYSDGVKVSKNILSDSKWQDSPLQTRYVINELKGIGSDNVWAVTTIDFEIDDKIKAVDSKLTKYETKELALANKFDSIETSLLMHIVFGPPEVLYNINYDVWTHDFWGKKCSKNTFKYHKIDVLEGFLEYLNSNDFYIPDSIKLDKYSIKSDSDSESEYSNFEEEQHSWEGSVNTLLDQVSNVFKKSPKCLVKYRNVFVLDGCWIINNSLTVSTKRDLLLLLNSSSKWRQCEYQDRELYLIERNKIDPGAEFRLYYIRSQLFCISQLHAHVKLHYLQESKNRINAVNEIIKLNNNIQRIIQELNLEHCQVDIGIKYDKHIIDILPWGWEGILAHEPILDWRRLRILYIASNDTNLEEILNCGIDEINNIKFIYIKHDHQARNAPFGNNIHPDDISEIKYQLN